MADDMDTKIKTYIFLDLETTGLPPLESKITEISFIAIHRDNLEIGEHMDEPRIIDKLSACLDPKKHISPEASEITGEHISTYLHRNIHTSDTPTHAHISYTPTDTDTSDTPTDIYTSYTPTDTYTSYTPTHTHILYTDTYTHIWYTDTYTHILYTDGYIYILYTDGSIYILYTDTYTHILYTDTYTYILYTDGYTEKYRGPGRGRPARPGPRP